MSATLVEKNLIERCIREEPKAQYEMYRALFSLMMSVCTRYERNRQDAESKMNAGFLKILTHLKERKEEVPFELWVRRIMINTVIDDHRKNKSRKTTETLTEEIGETDVKVVNDYLNQMEAEEFERMMQGLPEMSGRVFNLYAIDGFSYKEISDMLEMSEGTARWHVSQARTLLQKDIMTVVQKTLIQTQ
jgi:RNA polymerase sigma factor (sigma-70 family)